MAQALADKINNLDGEATKSGTVIGAAHRLFVDLKSLITQGDIEAIINEIKRGEDTLIQKYKEVLKEGIPQDIYLLLNTQLDEIEEDLAETEKCARMRQK